MSDDGQVWIPTYSTGSAHGWTDKEPQKQPCGFAPPKPQTVVIAPTYRPKSRR